MSVVITAVRPRRADRYGISLRDELDSMLLDLTSPWPDTSFQAIGDGWQEVDRKEAEALVPEITLFSLAYAVRAKPAWSGVCPPHAFLERFAQETCRYFTNGWRSDWRTTSRGWTPATTSTFDACIGVVSSADLGVLCVQDED